MPQKKDISPPDLDKYLEGRKHRYVSYKEGAIMYSFAALTYIDNRHNRK